MASRKSSMVRMVQYSIGLRLVVGGVVDCAVIAGSRAMPVNRGLFGGFRIFGVLLRRAAKARGQDSQEAASSLTAQAATR